MDREAWWAPVSPWDCKESDTTEQVSLWLSHGVFKGRVNESEDLCMSEWVSEVAQLYLTVCDPMDCSLPRSSVHGSFQARILEWVAISFSRGSSQPRDQTRVSRIVGRCFTIWATREVLDLCIVLYKIKDLRDNLGIFQVIEHCKTLQFLLLILYL